MIFFLYLVDLLDSVGLRNVVVSPSDAVSVNGPSSKPDAFQLQRQLSAPTSGKQWELIAAQLPTQFGFYASFNALMFEGSIVSLVNTVDNSELLVISYSSQDSVGTDTLVITIPGNNPVSFEVPSATTDLPFHDIGIELDGSFLIVTLNCVILNFTSLEEDPLPLSLSDDVVVNVFENQAIVRHLFQAIVCVL